MRPMTDPPDTPKTPAEPVKADRALAVGLLNHLVPVAELEDFTFGMARRIFADDLVDVSEVG